jgi:penicillin G amidase
VTGVVARTNGRFSGAHSDNGVPLLANDPHLSLDTPPNVYPIQLKASAAGLNVDVIGNSFPGVPNVALGHTKFISWGATVNPADVTDTYQEKIVFDLFSPSFLSTVYRGKHEPIIPILEIFRQNNVGDHKLNNITIVPPGTVVAPGVTVPLFTLIVPRRNQGPLISVDLKAGTGLSVQWTGFSATREILTGLIWSGAKDLDDFLYGLRFLSSGSIPIPAAT